MSSILSDAELTRELAQAGQYIGRFAPSPTGPLHFGSLLAAVASYLQARVAHGLWLIRIEDLDTPRVVHGSADDILRTLSAFGFEWHGAITYQSQRLEHYAAAIEHLRNQGYIYECSCSRAQIATHNLADAPPDTEELRYPGTCRFRPQSATASTALRFVAAAEAVSFMDTIQGFQSQDVAASSGDFVVRRRDGIYAYHLAVVVDDAEQGVTEVVRGGDLINSTERQILLQRALNQATPAYAHIPVAVDAMGRKLSKSAQSLPIRLEAANALLWTALQALCQSPPETLMGAPLNAVWGWAIEHWRPQALAGRTQYPAPPAT